MAEIKSTLEKVMERAASFGTASHEEIQAETTIQEGMKEAAKFFREENVDLAAVLAGRPATQQVPLRNGMVQTLLRNIMLPRETEQLATAEKAMQGLMQISQGSGELQAAFADLKAIMKRYRDHYDQLRKQLEQQFAQQMQMMEQNLAKQTGMKMKLEPAHHPKFKEEWQRVQTELNSQYGKALEQYKELIRKRLLL